MDLEGVKGVFGQEKLEEEASSKSPSVGRGEGGNEEPRGAEGGDDWGNGDCGIEC